MYPVSNAVKALLEAEATQYLRITGTDKNGVAISITDSDVMSGSFSIDRYCCNGQKLEIGTAIASELTFKLLNINGAFDSIAFEGSELYVEIGVETAPETYTWIPCGYFIVDEQTHKRNILTIKALDRMMMTDFALPLLNPWTDNNGNYITDNNGNVLFFSSYLAFPTTVSGLVSQICTMSGLTLGTDISSFPNASYSIPSAPSVQANTTLRDYLQWSAALMGTCAYIDWRGYLCFGWYASANYTSSPSNRFNSDVYENDITITGVTFADNDGNTYTAGDPGYMLDLSQNRLIGSNINSVLSAINTAIYGFTYRPFSASAMPAPYLFPLDIVTFEELDGTTHSCVLTNVNTTINGLTEIKGKGETEKTNSYARPSSMTAEQAALIQNSVNTLDNSLTQQEIFDRLTDGGSDNGIRLVPAVTRAMGASTPQRVALDLDYARYGTISADKVRTGRIESTTGGSYWDLDTGDFVTEDSDSGTGVKIADGQIVLYRNGTTVGYIDAQEGWLNIDGGSVIVGDVSGNGARIGVAGGSIELYGDIIVGDALSPNTGIDCELLGADGYTYVFKSGILCDYS